MVKVKVFFVCIFQKIVTGSRQKVAGMCSHYVQRTSKVRCTSTAGPLPLSGPNTPGRWSVEAIERRSFGTAITAKVRFSRLDAG